MNREPASYRDPAGFLFWRNGVLYRQVNRRYAPHYRRLMDSGLYEDLSDRGWLVSHRETEEPPADPDRAQCTIAPRRLPFISYPYEWCFEALKDAALLTLSIQEKALEYDMVLKDASAYNVAFDGSRPVFIDTLSFECYEEGAPWIAYRQFCEHFLAPLAMMARAHVDLGRLLAANVEGVPLAAASRALPWSTRLSPGMLMHIHLHARGEERLAESGDASGKRMSRRALEGLVDSLRGVVGGLRYQPRGIWSDYYDGSSYTEEGFADKEAAVREYLGRLDPGTVWDLGGNVGVFSRIAEEMGSAVVCMDADPACVQLHYLENRRVDSGVLPLLVDLTNPSPGLGWENRERRPLLERGPADAIMALALVHHLAIGHNVPLPSVAALFAKTGRDAIVEFVPKEDHQVQRMLRDRADIFDDYHADAFEAAFSSHFVIEERREMRDTDRVLYLMRGRDPS